MVDTPGAGPLLDKATKRTDLNDIMKLCAEAQEQAKAALALAAKRMKWYYDQHMQQVPFQVGNKVLLDLRNYQKVYRKLAARRYGPFTIEEKLSPVTFRLKWPNNLNKIHPVFHASKLSP